MPLSVDGMIPMIRRWIEIADKLDMPIQFETHRNCITNDLYATLCLIDAVLETRLCLDLSHFVVDRQQNVTNLDIAAFPAPHRSDIKWHKDHW